MRDAALIRTAWHIAVIAAVAAACWLYIDFAVMLQSFGQVEATWLAVLVALGIVDRFLMAGKWRHLLRAAGTNVPMTAVVSAYFQAGLMQRFLPSSLGGDALRAVLLSRRTQEPATVLGTMVVEKIVAMVSSIMLAVAALTVTALDVASEFRTALIMATGAAFAVTALSVYLSFRQRFVEVILSRLPRRVAAPLMKIYSIYLAYRAQPSVLAANLLYCLIEQSLQIGIVVIAAVALDTSASVATLVAALSIAQCLRKFAILTEGWVLGEFTTVLICGLFGIDQSQALAFSLLAHATDIVASLPGGVLFVRFTGSLTNLRASLTGLADGGKSGLPTPLR